MNESLDITQRIFPPVSDGLLMDLMGQSEEIATAVSLASGAEETWTDKEISQRVAWATGRWVDKDLVEIFEQNAREMGIPARPMIHNIRPVPQYGLGEIAVDLKLSWSHSELFLTAKDPKKIGIPIKDPRENFFWEVREGDHKTPIALLAGITLLENPSPKGTYLGTSLRRLTEFRLRFQLVEKGMEQDPCDLYVLCHRDYAEALSYAGFGALIKDTTPSHRRTEDVFSVVLPKTEGK